MSPATVSTIPQRTVCCLSVAANRLLSALASDHVAIKAAAEVMANSTSGKL